MATYTLISSQVLGSSAASVTFSSIPSTYKDLAVRISSRTDSAVVQDPLQMQINGSSATNYSYTNLNGTGATAVVSSGSTTAATQSRISYTDAATATTNTFGSAEIYIPNYAATVTKCFNGFGVQENNNSTAYMSATALLWNQTAAITALTFLSGSANFITGSSFYLYGI